MASPGRGTDDVRTGNAWTRDLHASSQPGRRRTVTVRLGPSGSDSRIDRGRRYRDAGADCIYPIMVIDEPTIVAFVAAFDGLINVYARPEAPALHRLAELGVARVSYGPWIQRLALRRVDQILADVARGVDPY